MITSWCACEPKSEVIVKDVMSTDIERKKKEENKQLLKKVD